MTDRKTIVSHVTLWAGLEVTVLKAAPGEHSYEYRAGSHCEHGYYHYRWSHACDSCHDDNCLYWGTFGKVFQEE